MKLKKKSWISAGCIGLLGACLLSLVGLTVFNNWYLSGYLVNKLPDELIPTAEYLLENPIPKPDYLSVVDLPPPLDDEKVCVLINDSAHTSPTWTRFLVNGQAVAYDSLEIGHVSPVTQYCVKVELTKGLYLFEIQPRITPLDTRYDYKWVISVD